MIFKTPKLTDRDIQIISDIDALKTKLRYNLANSPGRWFGLLRRTTLARNVSASNSIEGYNISREDALAAVEGVDPMGSGQDEAFRANRAYQLAMTYVIQLATDIHFSYSADLIKSLHYMMLEYDLTKSPGKWRPGPINVYDEAKKEIVYEAPDADDVPSLIDELIESLNSADKAIPRMVLGAMGHLNLVMIHPFRDGNGRMSRCLQTLILSRDGTTLDPTFCSIEEYLGRNSRDYYDVLQEVGGKKWNPALDASAWIRFCIAAHYIQANLYLLRVTSMSKLWDRLEAMIKGLGLPDRTMMALFDAALGWSVRNSTYRKAIDAISDQVASRDLKDLVNHGFLVAFGNARGRHYKASELVQKIRQETVEKKNIESPYKI